MLSCSDKGSGSKKTKVSCTLKSYPLQNTSVWQRPHINLGSLLTTAKKVFGSGDGGGGVSNTLNADTRKIVMVQQYF